MRALSGDISGNLTFAEGGNHVARITEVGRNLGSTAECFTGQLNKNILLSPALTRRHILRFCAPFPAFRFGRGKIIVQEVVLATRVVTADNKELGLGD